MLASIALVLMMGASVGPARGAPSAGQAPVETSAALEELVRAYRSGAHERAVAAATLWSDERIVLEVRRLIAEAASREKAEEREAARLAAAAILAERALSRRVSGDPALLAPGFSSAALLVEANPLGTRGRSFAQRFYLLVGLILHWHLELEVGYTLAAKALQQFPNDPDLQTAVGSMIETVASLRTYDLPPGSPEDAMRKSGGYASEGGSSGGVLPEFTLAQAATHYERALASDPSLDEARLRLAHVRLLMGLAEEALPDLERVATRAGQRRQRYLARLFAGYGRQQRGDAAAAAASYRACIADGPPAQTALLALGRSLDELGDKAGAQEAFARAAALDAPFDPWWSYGAGQPERFNDLVAQLRELVKARRSP
jgi:tetratricopeptide (TPR) repeat protein